MRNEENLVIAAEKLRLAARHIGEVTGSIATEEILDNIFKQFCIGKWSIFQTQCLGNFIKINSDQNLQSSNDYT